MGQERFRGPVMAPVRRVELPKVDDRPAVGPELVAAKARAVHKCPSCGSYKKLGMAFCVDCYAVLPASMKGMLWEQDRYLEALRWLRKDMVVQP
jgi:hypothetical protein